MYATYVVIIYTIFVTLQLHYEDPCQAPWFTLTSFEYVRMRIRAGRAARVQCGTSDLAMRQCGIARGRASKLVG
jgi:hypothetical protein